MAIVILIAEILCIISLICIKRQYLAELLDIIMDTQTLKALDRWNWIAADFFACFVMFVVLAAYPIVFVIIFVRKLFK